MHFFTSVTGVAKLSTHHSLYKQHSKAVCIVNDVWRTKQFMNPLYCSRELPAKARIVEENLYSKILLGVHITLRHQLTWHKLGSHTRSMSRSRAFPNAQYWSRHRRSCFKIAMKIFGPLSCHTQYLSCNPLMPPNVYKSKKRENHRFFFFFLHESEDLFFPSQLG